MIVNGAAIGAGQLAIDVGRDEWVERMAIKH